MATIDRLRVAKLANELTISRAVFAAAYDEVAGVFAGPSFKVIAQLENMAAPLDAGDKRNKRDFRAALNKANADGWLVDFVFEKFADLTVSAPKSVRPILQSIANKQQRFQDARKITMGTLTAMRRCCIIRGVTDDGNQTLDEAIGSGFLIGPHLVLTNYHVISQFLDENGQPRNGIQRPYVEFDYFAGRSPIIKPKPYEMQRLENRSWLLSHSGNVPEDVAETPENLSENLDYAVLVLDGRPGDMRGFYNLGKLRKELPAINTTVQLWQFPLGQTMKVISDNRAPPPDAIGFGAEDKTHARIYYDVNSERGSSGGLVLDGASFPVALHDAGFNKDAPEDARKNRGVPLHLIAHHAITNITTELLDQPPKTGWHPTRHLPVIGRQRLQRHIFNAAYKDARIITVMTASDANLERIPKIGRSYTREIIESCLPADAHHIITIEASLIDPDPFITAGRLVSAINSTSAAHLPLPTGETTLDADATGVLVQATVEALAKAAPGKIVWLMIDDIDTDPIGTQWGASSYLIALYRRIAREDKLRVVLAGLPRRLEGLEDLRQETGIILEDTLSEPPTQKELEDWMASHLTHHMPPDELAPRLASLVASMTQEQSGPLKAKTGDPITQTEATNQLLRSHARSAFLRKSTNG